MTFQEQLQLFRKKQGVGTGDFLVLISVTVALYSTFYHDKASFLFASLCASYPPIGIGIVTVKTRQRPSQQGWFSIAICGMTLFSIVTISLFSPR